jgi:protein-L-isoaspartate(D-aspartate) O-methyltransferase
VASANGGEPALDPSREARLDMVRHQIEARGIRDERVLEAMRKVPRHLFVPGDLAEEAYDDVALALGEAQTISQPYIVAFMTEALRLSDHARVLEIGTGSGYQAAVLGQIAREVYTVEVRPALAEHAAAVLARLGYSTVHVRCGDGSRGWPEAAPFDGIMVTAAANRIPPALLGQMSDGGRLVLPLGVEAQDLHVVARSGDRLDDAAVLAVRFVPFVWPEDDRDFS